MRRYVVIAAGLAAVAVAGCGSSSSSSPAASSTGTRSTGVSTTGAITVFAAASLQGTFTQLGKQFEAAHPGSKVTFSFGPSSGLATQIMNGAPADVFASAAVANMNQVVKAGDARGPSDFARNKMEVAVPPGNPGHVSSVDNLAKSSVKVAVCQPQVPCGVVAKEVFKNANISVSIEEGRLYRLNTISFVGVKLFRTPEELFPQIFRMKQGDPEAQPRNGTAQDAGAKAGNQAGHWIGH